MSTATGIDPNEHDHFHLRQRFTAVVNRYEFTLPGGDGRPVCFVEQKRFTFKEDIRFFTDESKQQELMRLKARQRFDPRARYDVTDAAGGKIGEIQKVFTGSLLRSTYKLYGADGEELASAREKSLPVALFRRAVGFIPYVDDVSDWLPIPYHFEFRRGDRVLGTHSREKLKVRDSYVIDMSGDPEHTIDRRLILAIAVGMDALQAR
jgi:uncharacterized protein YxjI